jgi:hypothetical protein
MMSLFQGVQFVKTACCGHASLALIASLAFGVGGARGASITETVPFTILAPAGANSTAQTINVSTPQFNPMLGTFEGGTTTISGTVDTALEFFSTGAGGPYDIFLSNTLNLAGIPGLFGQEVTGSVPANQTVFTLAVTIPFGPVDRGDPPELVSGSGTWNQLFSLPFPSLTINQSPASVLIPGMMISGSSVTTYTYTPAIAAIPEPRFGGAIMLLFGCGLVVTNWRAWRNKRAGTPIAQPSRGQA